MGLLNHFYRVVKTEAADYSHKPQGQLNASRLAQQKKAWKKNALSQGIKKKTLILADSMALYWSEEKRAEVSKRIKELLDNGFTIYLWQKPKPVLLTPQNITLLDIAATQNAMASADKDTMKSAVMMQSSLVADELAIVDYYWLTQTEILTPRTLPISELQYLQPTKMLEYITNCVADGESPLQAIDVDRFSLEDKKILDAIKERWPHLSKLQNYKSITLGDRDCDVLSAGGCLESTDDIKCSPENLSSVESLTLLPDTKLSNIVALISKLPALRKLNLFGYKNISDDLLKILNILSLEELNIGNSNVDNPNLGSLLANAKQLKKLNLSKCHNLKEGVIPIPDLLSLTELSLNFSNISTANLSNLITNASQLKKLDLMKCNGLNGNVPETINLLSLEELRLTGANINAPTLFFFLTHTRQLKTLNLSINKNLQEDLPGALDLSSLEKLTLNTSNISSNNLGVLLAKANQLKKLSLSQCTHLNGNLPEPLPLSSLEELDLSGSNINSTSLMYLLAEARQLKTLNLSKCNHLQEEVFKELDLSSLEELDLTDSNINTVTLGCLLAKASQLKKLKLPNCMHLNGNLPKPLHLSSLEELDLSGSNINSTNLMNLLAEAGQLKTLKLSKCSHLQEEVFKELDLSSLEELDLTESNINAVTLGCLLVKAMQLKKLTLLECTNLEENLPEPLHLSSLEELELVSSNISAVMLGRILANTGQLKVLNLWDCKNFQENIPNTINLSSLEELVLMASTTPPANLYCLLANASQLKKLNLMSYEGFNEDFPEIGNLSYLEELDLSVSNINNEVLIKLLVQVRQLQIISLDNCEHIDWNKLVLYLDSEQCTLSYTTRACLLTEVEKHLNSAEPAKPVKLAKPQHSANEQKVLDADTTENKNKILKATKLFIPLENSKEIAVNNYRLEAYHSITINPAICSIQQAFSLHQGEKDPEFEDRNYILCASEKDVIMQGTQLAADHSEQSYYIGEQSVQLTDQWQAISSLSCIEMLTHLYVTPQCNYSIQYSKRDNLYYIKSNTPSVTPVKLTYLLKLEKPPAPVSLPPFIQELVTQIKRYGSGTLNLSENATGIDYLNALKEQEKGACRHRMVVFHSILSEQYPEYPCRMIMNEVHAYVEVQVDGQWVTCDLGGYPAQLEVNNSLEQKLSPAAIDSVKKQAGDEKLQTQDEKALRTWSSERHHAIDVLTYCQSLVHAPIPENKTLLQVSSSKACQALSLSVQHYCAHIKRPFFYVHSPDDLVCSASSIKKEDGSLQGHLHPGPGGALYDFLNAHYEEDNPPVLLINYDAFSADDMVRLNSLVDEKRRIDGVPLPECMNLIGVLNTAKPGCYEGSDFYSRFSERQDVPVTEAQLMTHVTQHTESYSSTAGTNDEGIVIDLYNQADWQSLLLGQWQINGHQFSFKEGALAQALTKTNKITIKNGPWDDPSFHYFWQQALLLQHIDYEGVRISLPQGFSYGTSEGYDWEDLKSSVRWRDAPQKPVLLLNPSSWYDFFTRYDINNQGELNTLPGLLEVHEGSSLNLVLTQDLNSSQWAMLLDACHLKNITLNLYCPPGVIPAKEVSPPGFVSSAQTPTIPWDKTVATQTPISVTVSTDLDATLNQLTYPKDTLIISVDECEVEDLFDTVRLEQESQGLLRFKPHIHSPLKALQEGQTVILKGHFKPSVRTKLAELTWHTDTSIKGQLIVLSDEPIPALNTPIYHHEVEAAEKQAIIARTANAAERALLEPYYSRESLSSLQAWLHYHRAFMQESIDSAWHGLESLERHPYANVMNLEHSQEEANAFIDQRLKQIESLLAQAPYAFITGLTGVGKSTFITEYLSKHHPIYLGEEALLDWVRADGSKKPVLFIDEANLSAKQWSEFEGLFHNPPGIFIDGTYHPLSPDHKVIFAGNPVNYGDERQLAPFFARHGNAVVFEPMPIAFIYEKILKEKLQALGPEYERSLCQPILAVYQFLCNCSRDKILITPRELEMMLLLSMAAHKKHGIPLENLMPYYAYQVAKPLVPKEYQTHFERQFKTKSWHADASKVLDTAGERYVVTASRIAVYDQLIDCLTLRDFKITSTAAIHKRGGLGGLVIEGNPGEGKSELVIKTLLAEGYKEMHPTTTAPVPDKPFYRLPVEMPIDNKKKLLLKAFHEGAVVIVDEINSSPMMERFLNTLLMGKAPDGSLATKPGFFIIGTQNPVTFAGRSRPSTALSRRLITTTIPDYPAKEKQEILVSKGLEPKRAEQLEKTYTKLVQQANVEKRKPAPVFRDLLKYSEKLISLGKAPRSYPGLHQFGHFGSKRQEQLQTQLQHTISTRIR